MELFAIDGNPVPDGATVGTVIAADGVRLRYARWRAATRRAQGTICLLQGRSETIEKYFETITDLRNRGFAVATLDWRGQGGSDRRLRDPQKAHIDSFAEYDRDLEAFMQQVVLPDCAPPYFALAHSTGGMIAIRAAHSNRARFARMVVLSPLIDFGPTSPPPPFAEWFAASMTAIGLGELDAPGQATETVLNTPETQSGDHEPINVFPLRSSEYDRGFGEADRIVINIGYRAACEIAATHRRRRANPGGLSSARPA